MLSPGQLIDGRYRILRQLGEGGMGAVYEAENQRILRQVAIKVLHADVSQDAATVERFEREAQAAGRIGNKHIVEVLDLGSLPTGERYMVMELLQGVSLGDYLKQHGVLSTQVAIRIARHLLDALSAAHTVGIIHRDLKPDNLFLVEEDGSFLVKLLDFGISKFAEIAQDMGVTRTGSVIGTPQYMAPEQARGRKDIDHRVDVYAAGVVLYEMLSGRRPFSGDTVNELIIKVATEQPPSLNDWAPQLDAGLTQIVDRALSNDREARFASAQAFLEAIEQWQTGSGTFDVTQRDVTASRTSLTEHLPELGSGSYEFSSMDTGMAASPLTRTSSAWRVPKSGAWAHTQKEDPVELPGFRARKWPLLLGGVVAAGLGAFALYAYLPATEGEGIEAEPPLLSGVASALGAAQPLEDSAMPLPAAPTSAPSPSVLASSRIGIAPAPSSSVLAEVPSVDSIELIAEPAAVIKKAHPPIARRKRTSAKSLSASGRQKRNRSTRDPRPVAATPPPPADAPVVKRSTTPPASQNAANAPRRHNTIRRDLDL